MKRPKVLLRMKCTLVLLALIFTTLGAILCVKQVYGATNTPGCSCKETKCDDFPSIWVDTCYLPIDFTCTAMSTCTGCKNRYGLHKGKYKNCKGKRTSDGGCCKPEDCSDCIDECITYDYIANPEVKCDDIRCVDRSCSSVKCEYSASN